MPSGVGGRSVSREEPPRGVWERDGVGLGVEDPDPEPEACGGGEGVTSGRLSAEAKCDKVLANGLVDVGDASGSDGRVGVLAFSRKASFSSMTGGRGGVDVP